MESVEVGGGSAEDGEADEGEAADDEQEEEGEFSPFAYGLEEGF